MSEKFLKPFIPRPDVLDPTPGPPQGFVTKDGMWAAVPCGKKFVIIHNGQQVHVSNNYKAARTYISKEMKSIKRSRGPLEKFL